MMRLKPRLGTFWDSEKLGCQFGPGVLASVVRGLRGHAASDHALERLQAQLAEERQARTVAEREAGGRGSPRTVFGDVAPDVRSRIANELRTVAVTFRQTFATRVHKYDDDVTLQPLQEREKPISGAIACGLLLGRCGVGQERHPGLVRARRHAIGGPQHEARDVPFSQCMEPDSTMTEAACVRALRR